MADLQGRTTLDELTSLSAQFIVEDSDSFARMLNAENRGPEQLERLLRAYIGELREFVREEAWDSLSASLSVPGVLELEQAWKETNALVDGYWTRRKLEKLEKYEASRAKGGKKRGDGKRKWYAEIMQRAMEMSAEGHKRSEICIQLASDYDRSEQRIRQILNEGGFHPIQ
jgi:hypothetical protein